MNKYLLLFLKEYITENRLEIFNKVLSFRTRYFSVILEDIYQSQNASAVLRTADCFGVQDIHIIENRNEYQINPDVAVGSTKWLNLNYYNELENNTLRALTKLKTQGYRIVATTPHINDVDLYNFDVTKGKFALVFGNEREGLSNKVIENADEFLRIPMYGFTESYNISVSAALCMQYLSEKVRNSNVNWQLSVHEKDELILEWIINTLKKPETFIKKFNEINNGIKT
jgi:tRNA (guanosine-2'-O-)-methyltransferase